VLPPIPAPPPIQTIEKGPRPVALKFFIATSLVTTILWLILPQDFGNDSELPDAFFLVINVTLTAGWVAVLWFLWQGRNWARIAVMVVCILGMIGLPFINDYEGPYAPIQKGLLIFDTLFSLAWFVWLRSPAMVAFTKGTKE
jgi:hypothetical protein